jgi:hypothetical protein
VGLLDLSLNRCCIMQLEVIIKLYWRIYFKKSHRNWKLNFAHMWFFYETVSLWTCGVSQVFWIDSLLLNLTLHSTLQRRDLTLSCIMQLRNVTCCWVMQRRNFTPHCIMQRRYSLEISFLLQEAAEIFQQRSFTWFSASFCSREIRLAASCNKRCNTPLHIAAGSQNSIQIYPRIWN